jgi:uncharacterized protein (DUF305 family)
MRVRVRAAIVATALLAAAAPRLPAQDPMASMPMGHIMVPPGASYTAADVEFMQGMIAHHAQAIHMSKMAATHGASPKLLKFTQKVDQGQTAEIVLMQEWLRRNGQFVPDTSSWRTHMMPGMLTADQLRTLEASRGTAFDRNFLEMMIQHHQGALKMVEDLFATPRAGQDVDVSVFANDVVTVQTAEIGVMRRMLSELPPGP